MARWNARRFRGIRNPVRLMKRRGLRSLEGGLIRLGIMMANPLDRFGFGLKQRIFRDWP